MIFVKVLLDNLLKRLKNTEFDSHNNLSPNIDSNHGLINVCHFTTEPG
jgi:hypothetical protein